MSLVGRANVLFIGGWPGLQFKRLGHYVLVGEQAEEMSHTVEMSATLVIGFDLVPARFLDVAVFEHGIFGFGVLHPALTRQQVHRAEFPQFRRITCPLLKTTLLFLVADR